MDRASARWASNASASAESRGRRLREARWCAIAPGAPVSVHVSQRFCGRRARRAPSDNTTRIGDVRVTRFLRRGAGRRDPRPSEHTRHSSDTRGWLLEACSLTPQDSTGIRKLTACHPRDAEYNPILIGTLTSDRARMLAHSSHRRTHSQRTTRHRYDGMAHSIILGPYPATSSAAIRTAVKGKAMCHSACQ